MTDQQVLAALDLYEKILKEHGEEPIEVPHNRCPISFQETRNHGLSMIAPIRQFLAYYGEGLMYWLGMVPIVRWFIIRRKREKLMRWLGFLQCITWATKIHALDSLKDHNR
jgi:hypothetical protein